MQRNDGFSRARGTCYPGWTTVIALNQTALRWMKEYRPFVPGVVEGALKLFDVGHQAEAALGVGMPEWIDRRDLFATFSWTQLAGEPYRFGLGPGAGGQIEQRFSGLTGQVIR